MGGVLDVARYENRLAASVFNQAFGLHGIVVLAQVGDQDICALPSIG